MRAVIKGFIAASLIAGSSLAATAPADARDRTGTALLAGVIGLGIGAAIASDSHNNRGHYSNDYYSGGYAPGYYSTPSAGYYGGGYGYSSGYGYDGDYGRHHDGRSGYSRGGDRRGWQDDRRDRDNRHDERGYDHSGWNRR
jgi:hypothetical protein